MPVIAACHHFSEHILQTFHDLNDCHRPRLHRLFKQPVYKVSYLQVMHMSQCAEQNVAVRKNRYVVLPVDFEEAWKVSAYLPLFGPSARRKYLNSRPSLSPPPAKRQARRRDFGLLCVHSPLLSH